ncbi:MAG: hypothetical protein AAF635_16190, partial [Cyanobacteria bacterium P01_C01_bin.69]
MSTRGDTEVIREELLQLLNFYLKSVDFVSTVINILTKFSVHLSRIPTHHDHLVAGSNISITALSLKLYAIGTGDTSTHVPAEPTPSPALPQALALTPLPTPTSLNSVPPNGLDSLSEPDWRYFQSMGPLEYAARLGGVPNVPTW